MSVVEVFYCTCGWAAAGEIEAYVSQQAEQHIRHKPTHRMRVRVLYHEDFAPMPFPQWEEDDEASAVQTPVG